MRDGITTLARATLRPTLAFGSLVLVPAIGWAIGTGLDFAPAGYLVGVAIGAAVCVRIYGRG